MTEWRCLVALKDGSTDMRVVEAPSGEAASGQVAAEGLALLDLREGSASFVERLQQPITYRRRLGIGDQSLLLTQLATLVRSGLPVDRSLDLLRDQALRSGQRTILAHMTATVRAGGGLAAAFAETAVFPAYVTGVIRASERGGGLGDALASLAERLTLAAQTRRQLLTALTYPAAILAATLAALAIVLTLVVPQFRPIFAGQEDKLPSLTQGVLALSNAITDSPLMLAVILFAPFIILFMVFRSSTGRRLLETYGHRLPLLGVRDQYLAAQFTGILATLLGNGVRVVDAMPLVRDAIGSRRWRAHADDVERRIREGSSLSSALLADGLLPSTAIRLIEVGEKSGKLAQTCAQASAVIGEATRARIERIVALANPIAIITLGGMVAALVGGVMLGIFALGDFAG
jgi:type II secretory pathway component PulF